MTWTEERIAKLIELWLEGNTATYIAKELGNISRNAVIGKIHRLGISSRDDIGKKNKKENEKLPKKTIIMENSKPSTDHKPIIIKKSIDRKKNILKNSKKSGRILSIIDLTERKCKWPIGHPNEEEFHFCGKPCDFNSPYCSEHMAVAYIRLSDKDKKKDTIKIEKKKKKEKKTPNIIKENMINLI